MNPKARSPGPPLSYAQAAALLLAAVLLQWMVDPGQVIELLASAPELV
jgi:hypothetical protein